MLTPSKLLQSDRRRGVQSALSRVQVRNQEIQNIEKQMIAIAQLSQELEATVIQQEVAIVNIEQQGEQVEENVAKANVEIDGAITSAKAARRKKFWCLGIVSECNITLRWSIWAYKLQFSSSLLLPSSLLLLSWLRTTSKSL